MPSARVRAKGQVTIPTGIREAARLEEGDPVEFEMTADGILMRPQKVIDATQAWFWTPEWQAGEREADEEYARGEGKVYMDEESFQAALDAIPSEE
ncbi:MAG: AbrB/MazE/SpoVT family DNA-binding domain-containing protein [Thermoleophilaceae bacterium]|jgi:AbrB family looped-hinge helix DNA binding protein|nr:AbrB/MazE/SpoVT family DNA-binding domain-containing protein [Thermoleophilaceae bacterium]